MQYKVLVCSLVLKYDKLIEKMLMGERGRKYENKIPFAILFLVLEFVYVKKQQSNQYLIPGVIKVNIAIRLHCSIQLLDLIKSVTAIKIETESMKL